MAFCESLEQKVAKFQMFIDDVLKERLKGVHLAIEKASEQIMRLADTENSIRSTSQLVSEEPGKSLNTQINIGCDVYMKANTVPQIYLVCVGLGHYLEYTQSEALNFIQNRNRVLMTRIQELHSKEVHIRAQIAFAMVTIRDLQKLR